MLVETLKWNGQSDLTNWDGLQKNAFTRPRADYIAGVATRKSCCI
jgi:hypothetical protein